MSINIIKLIVLLIIILVVLIIIKKILYKDRYYFYLSVNKIHPNNYEEVKKVEYFTKNRNIKDIEFHKLTDKSVVPAFQKVLDKNNLKFYNMESIILKHVPTILALKNKYNRARPYQINNQLDSLYSYTSDTPSYPAGHAYQAWVLYHVISLKYPQIKDILYQTAEYCDHVRVIAGLHYPSDGEYSKKLVMTLYKNT